MEGQVRRSWEIAPSWFGRLPKANCRVKEIEAYRAADMALAFYMPPTADGERPGTYYINTHDLAGKALHQIAAVTYHEANPGHHFQIALEMEFDERPALRRFGGLLAGASFAEGWGLYSERLADEMNLYVDDWERLGMLAAQAHRAARLITDTGLHAFGWSRQDAIEKLVAGGSPRGESEVEVDRYIALPAQALAYMVGMVEIEEARRRTQDKEGDAFDLKAFHDRLLALGQLPLQALRRARLGLPLGLLGLEQQVVEEAPLPQDLGLGQHRASREPEGPRPVDAARVQSVAHETQRGRHHAVPHELRPDVDEPRPGDRRDDRSGRCGRIRPEPPAAQHRHGGERLPGPCGRRTVGRSDIVRTPPGRSTRNASRKNRAREGKWKAASTLITPSKEPSANGRTQASAQTPRAPAARSLSRPASSWDHVMLMAVSERGCTVAAITGSWAASPLATSSTSPSSGNAAAIRSTSRRTAIRASDGSPPSPSHRPRFSQPGASARKKSGPIES